MTQLLRGEKEGENKGSGATRQMKDQEASFT